MSEQPPSLSIETTDTSVSVYRVGVGQPIVVQSAQPDHRPFIHPILPPGGTVAVTEDAPSHHPWQHGLFIGLNDVNGYGFWTEGLWAERAAKDGTFHPRLSGVARADGDTAFWAVETEYRDPNGGALLTEIQAWQLTDHGNRFDLDLTWSLTAAVPVRFGAYEYGGLFLRMPYRDETGGSALNSEGARDKDAEAARARWVSCQMAVEGNPEDAFVAIMDHPENLRYPAPWRVDYQLGIAPSVCIAGEWALPSGDTQTFRHRVSVFERPVPTSEVEQVWTAFSTAPSNILEGTV